MGEGSSQGVPRERCAFDAHGKTLDADNGSQFVCGHVFRQFLLTATGLDHLIAQAINGGWRLVAGGVGGGSGIFPGNSNWTTPAGLLGGFEVWSDRRGDIARALIYMDVRYEGGTHQSGAAEPDLVLTDNESLISLSATGSNLPVAYMGKLSVLLQWHAP